MKRIVFLLVFLAVAYLASGAVNTVYYGESLRIAVTLASQDPDPVEPGKIVEVNFKLDNQGASANNLVFEMQPEYPFALVSGEESEKNIGTLGTSQNSDRTVFVKYKLKVDNDAVDGSHEIKVRYKHDNFDSWTTVEDLALKVQSKDAILSIDKFATVPEVIAPGSKARLVISLKNHASSALKDVKVTLDLGKSGDEETPFSSIGSTNEKVVSFIEAKSIVPLEFTLLTDADAKSKVYKIPIRITYSDIINKNYSKTITAALVIGVEPELSFYIDGTTVYTADSTGEVTVKIVNKGLTDIKFLSMVLTQAQGYKILSPPEVYIGNIDSDDYETVDYKINVEKKTEKGISLPLAIEYKDANNQNYKKSIVLELPIYIKSEAKKLGLIENGNAKFGAIAFIAVAITAFFGFRMWRKRRK